MTDGPRDGRDDFEALALARLSKVLGPGPARKIFGDVLQEAGLEKLSSADDLYAFAKKLTAREGFEAAVGGLLCVAAVMRGATPQRG